MYQRADASAIRAGSFYANLSFYEATRDGGAAETSLMEDDARLSLNRTTSRSRRS